MCDAYDTDGPSAWSETWRRARKAHGCCACGETIRPGDRYHYSSGVWEGRGESWKHCARCWVIYQSIADHADGSAIRLDLNCGELWRDNFSAPEPAELAFLTPDEAQALAGS